MKRPTRFLYSDLRLRAARNLVRCFGSAYERGNIFLPNGEVAHWVKKYEKAAVLVAKELLSK